MGEPEKRCYRCGEDRPLTDFIAKRNGQTCELCSPCLHDILTNGGQRGKKERLKHTEICPTSPTTRHDGAHPFGDARQIWTSILLSEPFQMTRETAMPFLVSVAMLITACRYPDPNPEPPASCESGFILDGSTCVPESCGTGRWGNLPVDDDTVYVDVTVEEGGVGTEAAPYATIQRGLDRAGALGGALVAVAAGTYPETLEMTTDHADVHLAGRCWEMVILDASVGDEETPGINIEAEYVALELSGLTMSRSLQAGLVVASGEVVLRDSVISGSQSWGVEAYHPGLGGMTDLVVDGCLIEGNSEAGLVASNTDTVVSLRDTTVMDTQPNANGEFGWGIWVQGGASLRAEGCLIDENTALGLATLNPGTEVTILDTTVQDTQPDMNGEFGQGVWIQNGATLQAVNCLIDRNTLLGLIASDADTEVALHDTTVEDTQPNASGEFGRGIEVQDGATLHAEGCLIDGNTENGLMVGNPATEVTLMETTVRNTQPNAKGVSGLGISVQDGATLHAEGCLIDGNTNIGLLATGSSTEVTLRETTVKDAQPDANGMFGRGIEVQDGATLRAEDCLLNENAEAGLYASDPGTEVILRDTIVRDTQPDAKGGGGRGIEVVFGATLHADGCLIDDNTGIGLLAASVGTEVNLHHSMISGTKPGADLWASAASGVTVQDGALFLASGIVVLSNHGPGLLAILDGILECVGCTIQDNQFAGAAALNGGGLTITDSTIQGTSANANLLGGAGVYAWPWLGGSPTVTLTNTVIQDNPLAGVWLIGNGTYQLTGNTISGGNGESFGSGSRCGDAILARDGVMAWDGTTGLLLQDNAFLDASGAGVFLDGSSAVLSGNVWSGNAMDLVVQNQSCATIPDNYSEAPRHVYCPYYNYPSCYAEFFFVAMPADPIE